MDERMYFAYVDNGIAVPSDKELSREEVEARALERLLEIIREGEVKWLVEEE